MFIMDKILDDIRELIHQGNEDEILEFAEMLMVENKNLSLANEQLMVQAKHYMKNFEPEPEPEYRGTEKIEYREGKIDEEKFFEQRSSS